MRMRLGRPNKDSVDQVSQTVQALQALQKTLHNLTPAEQARVQATLPFAASEWLQGLANSIGAQENADTLGGSNNSLDISNSSSRSKQLDALLETADDARARLTPNSGKVVLVMVGIPARGKSILCHKLEHFLCWRGTVTKAFKVGSYRRGEILPQGGLSMGKVLPTAGSARARLLRLLSARLAALGSSALPRCGPASAITATA